MNRAVPSPEDLDFWLGTWIVRWGAGGGEWGRNVVARALGGRVVEERFDGRPGVDLVGMSVSVFDERHGLWHQTWVDDQGNYFALEGAPVDGEMHLHTTAHNGSERNALYRMRFFDIERDSLSWTWERSDGADGAFDELWRLRYVRQG